jgi:hypothetical protein
MRKLLLVTLAVSAAYPLLAKAEMSLDTYTRFMRGTAQERELAETYIEGVGEGYSWANTELAKRKMPLLFCYNGPVSKKLFNKLAADEIAKYLATIPNAPRNVPMTVMLKHQLQTTYPCQ